MYNSIPHLKIATQELHNIMLRIAVEDINLSSSDKKKYSNIDKGKPAELNYVERLPFFHVLKKANKKNQEDLMVAFSRWVRWLDGTQSQKFDFTIYEAFFPKGSEARPHGPNQLDLGKDVKANLTMTYLNKLIFPIFLILVAIFSINFGDTEDVLIAAITFFIVAGFSYFVGYKDHLSKINEYKVKLHKYFEDINIYCGEYEFKTTGADNYGFTDPEKHRDYKNIKFSRRKVNCMVEIGYELFQRTSNETVKKFISALNDVRKKHKKVEDIHPAKIVSDSEMEEYVFKSFVEGYVKKK